MTTAVSPFTRSFTADPDHSSFQAQLRHMGVGTFRTGFEDVSARLEHGPDGRRLTGRARVDSITIKRRPEFRAHVVDGEDFFDAGRHPEIAFASTRLDLAEDGTASIPGQLKNAVDWASRPFPANALREQGETTPSQPTQSATPDNRDYVNRQRIAARCSR